MTAIRSPQQSLLLVSLALIAFAANSVLCRYALRDSQIDPASFTLIRLFSGAIMLVLLVKLSRNAQLQPTKQHAFGAGFLLLYAVTFSFAYISLDTATGALVLFGTVQIALIGFTLFKGYALSRKEIAGLIIACAGFLSLTAPHITAPSWQGLALMLLAGIGWAGYTLNGKGSQQPLNDTALNFVFATLAGAPLMFIFLLLLGSNFSLSGIVAAIASGALASGVGYAIWYAALPSISTTQAAVSQLLVPVIAAFGGLLLLAEPLTLGVIVAGLLILGGIYLVVKK